MGLSLHALLSWDLFDNHAFDDTEPSPNTDYDDSPTGAVVWICMPKSLREQETNPPFY